MKVKILEGILAIVKKKGVNFTMDDLAAELSMSKKTLYRVFPNKSSMLRELDDYVFGCIKQEKEKIIHDDSLTDDERFYRILCVIPEGMEELNLSGLYRSKNSYPDYHARLAERMREDWESTAAVLEQAIEAGYFRRIDKELFRVVYMAALERFLSQDDLYQIGVSYADALAKLARVLVEGIRA